MNGLTKFSNVPSTKWLHFNFVTSIYNLYTKNNTHPSGELPNPDHKSVFKSDEKKKNDDIYHMPGRLICHLNKHKESLLRNDHYDDVTKWAYYGLFSVVIHNWNSIHKREKLALINSIVKIIRSISSNGTEINFKGENLNNYRESLIIFLKFILLSDSNTLSKIKDKPFVSDDYITNWKYLHDFLNECVYDLNSFNGEGNGIFMELINEYNYAKDFSKLLSIIYWVKSLKIVDNQLESASKAVLSRFKSVYTEECDLRGIINISYYATKIDPKLLSDGFLSDCLFTRFSNNIYQLNVIDCYHLLYFLKTFIDSGLANKLNCLYLPMAFNILANIHVYINGGELDTQELEELSSSIFNGKVDLTNLFNEQVNDKKYYKLKVINDLLKEVSEHLGILEPFCIKVHNEVSNIIY
uniref:Uncharacterized protein n=1 Tax=Theileria annulata TaxID=5874 RepID=A0A3B0MLF9_THEAN